MDRERISAKVGSQAGNGQFGQGFAEVCGEPVDGMQTAVVAGGGVTPSRTTSDPPCPDAGRPTDAKSSLGRAGSPGSGCGAHSASLHEPFTRSTKGWQRSRAGADQQLSRRVWHGMIDSGRVAANIAKARRRRPTGPPCRGVARVVTGTTADSSPGSLLRWRAG